MIYWEKRGGKEGEGEHERGRDEAPLGNPSVSPPSPELSTPSLAPSHAKKNFLCALIPDTWLGNCFFFLFLPLPFVSFCLWWSVCPPPPPSLCFSVFRQTCNFLMSTPLPTPPAPSVHHLSSVSHLRCISVFASAVLRRIRVDMNK